MTSHTPDITPAWALAEKAAHAREHAVAQRRLAIDDEWLALWLTRIHAPLDTPFDVWYAGILDAGMARCAAARERERGG